MEFIENLKKLGLKENKKYLILVIWLLIDIILIQIPIKINIQIGSIMIELWDLIGVIIFLPYLIFLMFLFLLSIFSKEDIKHIPSWKVLLIFMLTLPLMAIISIILFMIFAFSIFSYFFFSSWFMLYGAYLISRNVDERLKRHNYRKLTRSMTFLVGILFSLFLLVIFFVPRLGILDIIYTFIPELSIYPLLNLYVKISFIIIGVIISAFGFLTLVYLTRKIFNAWIGLFSILVVIYSYFLVVKVFIAVQSVGTGGSSSVMTQILMIIIDVFIILYSISTLMGSQAEILRKRVFKKSERIGLDTILMWLVFSKVAYEFIHYFPFDWLQGLPYIGIIDSLNEAWVNFFRNIGILLFFLAILVILGLYEIKKYYINQKLFIAKVDKEIQETLSFKDDIEKYSDLSKKKYEAFEKDELEAEKRIFELDNSGDHLNNR